MSLKTVEYPTLPSCINEADCTVVGPIASFESMPYDETKQAPNVITYYEMLQATNEHKIRNVASRGLAQ